MVTISCDFGRGDFTIETWVHYKNGVRTMGCWNGTCAVSNLPITHGTEVIGILALDVMGSEPYQYLTPLPFFIEGEYNDYGAIENEHGKMLDFIIGILQEKCMHLDQGENKYHEQEVDPKKLTWESISSAVHEGRLRVEVSPFGNKKTEHNFTILQVRKDVFDMVLENHVMGLYKEDMPYGTEVSYVDVLDDYDDFYRSLIECYAPEEDEDADDATQAALNKMNALMKSLTGPFRERNNYISSMLSDESHERPRNGIITAQATIVPLAEAGIESDKLFPIVENAIQLRVLDSFMGHCHRQWQVPGYAGQEGNTAAHNLLASAIISVSEKMETMYDDEDD